MIIHNPASGARDVQVELAEARAYLTARGWSIEYEPTRTSGDARRLARQASDAGLDAVLVAGGDGTLNEAVNALVGTRTAVGVLPCGTANVWARQMGMRLSNRALIGAARLMDEADLRVIDVGCVTVNLGTGQETTRYFLLWSGLGLDAYVTRSVEPRQPSFKRWGVIAYSLAALRAAISYRGVRAEIDLDDRRVHARAMLILVSNAELYAGYFHLAPQARIDDGWLDVVVFHGRGFLEMIRHAALLDPRLQTYRAKRVLVTTHGGCDVHVDAEPIGTTPAEVTIAPRALRVLVPATAPSALFSIDRPLEI